MKYRLKAEMQGEGIFVPGVLLNKFAVLSDVRLRVGLALCWARGEQTPQQLMIALENRYKLETIEKELLFLEGLGICEPTGEVKRSFRGDISIAKPPKISRSEVLRQAADNDDVKILIRLAQELLGQILSPNDTAILATLLLYDGLSLEALILGITHCTVIKDNPNVRYIEKVMRDWLLNGITTGDEAEAHLEHLREREKHKIKAAAAIDIKTESINYSENIIVSRWFEEFGYDDEMIREATMFAGEKRTVRYINGILTKWHQNGYKTVKDVRNATNGANLSPLKSVSKEDDVMIKRRTSVPVFKKRGAEYVNT